MPKHPAACPHCGGTIVNQFQLSYLVAPAILKPDGTIVVGDSDVGDRLEGQDLLFCFTCNSTYPQPAEVPVLNDNEVDGTYPEPPPPGDPRYRGMGVTWSPTITGPVFMGARVAGGEDG